MVLTLRLLLGLDALRRAIGSGSYSDKPASSRRRNSSAASRAEASLPVAADRRSSFRGRVRSAANGWRLCWRGAGRFSEPRLPSDLTRTRALVPSSSRQE